MTGRPLSHAVSRILEPIAHHASALSRFSLIGLLATGVYLVVSNAIIASGLMPSAPASVLAYFAGMFFSFLGQSQLTFRSGKITPRQVLRYCLLSAGGIALSYGTIYVLEKEAGVTGLPATLAAAVAIALFSFMVMRAWVFNSRADR
jgi:putative flippase GtrA